MPIMSFRVELSDMLPFFEPDGSISFTTREYEEIVCTECARVAGRRYFHVITPLWWSPLADGSAYASFDQGKVIKRQRLRRNRTYCGDNAPCYWCGCCEGDMCIVGDGVGRIGHPICGWCYDWHNRYVWPQLVERTAHTLEAGRLLPRMPFSLHCNTAEYLVSMW